MPEKRNDPTDPGGRPIPDKPRKPNSNIQIYAILVGINDYQPSGGEQVIPKLFGCDDDINDIKAYLIEQYGARDEEGAVIDRPSEVTEFTPVADSGDVPYQLATYGRLHLCHLLDEKATYNNVVDAFQKVFVEGGGTGEDSFWFHFSGHGTEQFTAREFFRPERHGAFLPSLATNGKDQCLVCYNPEGRTENILLADKELALLINKTYEGLISLDEENRPHIVITLDCCHSGTGTRGGDDDEIRSRDHKFFASRNWEEALNEEGAIRPLSSYLNGEYEAMVVDEEARNEGNLFVPAAPHVVLTASDNLEVAGDASFGGLFTSKLLEALRRPEPTNYMDLFYQTRNLVVNHPKEHKQTPQVDAIGGFNPYTRFLEGWDLRGNLGQFPLVLKNDQWYVKFGAINGLPKELEEDVELYVYDGQTQVLVGNAFIESVSVQDSLLSMGFAAEQEPEVPPGGNPNKILGGVSNTATLGVTVGGVGPGAAANTIDTATEAETEVPLPPPLVLDPQKAYVAQIKQLPVEPFFFHDQAGLAARIAAYVADESQDEEDRMAVQLRWDRLASFNIHFSEEVQGEARMVITANEAGDLTITDLDGELRTHDGLKGDDEDQMVKLVLDLEDIVRWKRMLQLDNPSTKLNRYFSAALEFADQNTVSFDEDDNMVFHWTASPLGEVEISIPEAGFFLVADEITDQEVHGIPYRIRLNFKGKRNTKDLYFYLFNLTDTAGVSIISTTEETKGLRIERTAQQDFIHLTGIKQFTMSKEEQHMVAIHKLLVTKREIDPELLEQEGFGTTRSGGGDFAPIADKNDWAFLTLKVDLTKLKGMTLVM